MVKQGSGVEVVYDTSRASSRGSGSKSYANEWRNFMSSNLGNMYKKAATTESAANSESEEEEKIDMKKVLKDIEFLGSSSMSWKDRKASENRKVVLLGGKPPKRQRLPLSVAKVPMKRQRLREEKKLQEDILLGRFQRKKKASSKQPDRRRSSEADAPAGFFKKGVLNVKHLLKRPSHSSSDGDGGGRSFDSAAKGRQRGKRKGQKK